MKGEILCRIISSAAKMTFEHGVTQWQNLCWTVEEVQFLMWNRRIWIYDITLIMCTYNSHSERRWIKTSVHVWTDQLIVVVAISCCQKFSTGDVLCEMKMVDTVKCFVMLWYHKNLQGGILWHMRDDRILWDCETRSLSRCRLEAKWDNNLYSDHHAVTHKISKYCLRP